MNRRDQREQAFILIFERTINNDTIAQIVENAGESRDLVLSAFAEKVATGVQDNEAVIDEKIEQNIHGWKMSRLSRVSLALLRLAIYEMMYEYVCTCSNDMMNHYNKVGVHKWSDLIV